MSLLQSRGVRLFLSMVVLVILCGVSAVWAEEPVGQGTLQVISRGGESEEKPGKVLEFPLEHTEVEASISGFVSRVTVTQSFANPFGETIEAVYVFPLPEDAAVFDMTMKIGERTIKGVIKKREEARKIYQQAVAAGKTASLLEQERPNIFTQTVGNILPGETILIEISYVDILKYDHGEYSFVFPMVVGPRFNPAGFPGGIGAVQRGDTGKSGQAVEVQYLHPGERSGHDIDITVSLDAGVPIRSIDSKSHRFDFVPGSYRSGSPKAKVRLHREDRIPNKDFILEYRVTGEEPAAAMLTHRGAQGGYFMLMVQPKEKITTDEITPKEMIFVLDCSGSMSGAPMEQSKALVRHALREMNPADSFQIIRFSSSASGLAPRPLGNTPENVQKGITYINSLHGTGGTRMIEGIKAALDFPEDQKRLRTVCFLTDGYIGNETQILAEIEDKLGGARLFSFGVGSSPNRYLLERMAETGRGAAEFVRPDEGTDKPVNRFYERIRNPYYVDISVDWGGLDVKDVYPNKIPDLYSSQPVFLFGRYGTPGTGTVTVSGTIAGENHGIENPVTLPESEPANACLASAWARSRVKDLMARMYRNEKPQLVEQVTNLCLEYRLMSKYTSFVAVEEKVRTGPDGTPVKITVPVEMPEAVSHQGVFGEEKRLRGIPRGTRTKMMAPAALPESAAGSSMSPDISGGSKPVLLSEPPRPVPQPVVPEVSVEYLGYMDRNGKAAALIKFQGNVREFNAGDEIQNQFKVISIAQDALELFSYRTRRRLVVALGAAASSQEKTWWGLNVTSPSVSERAQFGLAANEGVKITAVAPGGPADKAGLAVGEIIVTVTIPDGGKNVIGNVEDLEKVLAGVKSGDRVKVTVIRSIRRASRINLTFGARPLSPPPGTWY